jgi:hypothetical protein
MIKTGTFAALTLLATLTAVQAALKNAAPALPSIETRLQTGSLPKAKMPPRRSLAPKVATIGAGQMTFE